MPSSSHRSPPHAAAAANATAASPSAASSVADNRLGLSAQDVATLRQHQQLAHSQARSSAGSQASSQGRLLLDPGSLQLLSRHFDRVMQAISQRLEQVGSPRTLFSLLRKNACLTIDTAQPRDGDSNTGTIRPLRQCHPDGRQRDRTLPSHTTANRRVGDRVRQDQAHSRDCSWLPSSCRAFGATNWITSGDFVRCSEVIDIYGWVVGL